MMVRVLLMMMVVEVGSNACDNSLLEETKMYCEKNVIVEDSEIGACCVKVYKSIGFGSFIGSEVNDTSKSNVGIKVFR